MSISPVINTKKSKVLTTVTALLIPNAMIYVLVSETYIFISAQPSQTTLSIF